MSWRDEAIDTHLTAAIDVIANEVGDFSRIDLAAWFERGAMGSGFRVFDRDGAKLRISFAHPLMRRSDEIAAHLKQLRRIFSENGATWASMWVRVTGDGEFRIEFDYDDPDRYRLANIPE